LVFHQWRKKDDPPLFHFLSNGHESRRIAMMTLKEVLSLGSRLTQFLRLFADCFKRNAGRSLARVYVQGLLSDIQRKNREAIALAFGRPARTLQRLLESIKWDEEKVCDRCQQIVATEHAHPEAIGIIDESGIGKSDSETAGAAWQCGARRPRACRVGSTR
jgi:SRSO17 transposase